MFEINNNIITKFEGTDAQVVIPPEVTMIGKSVFYGCEFLKSVRIHRNVLAIGDDAFGECSSLTIYCEHSTEPEDWARRRFGRWNSARRPVYWGVAKNGLVEVDGCQYVVKGDSAVLSRFVGAQTAVVVPESVEAGGKTRKVTAIGKAAFENSVSLFDVTLPSTIEEVGENAFENCPYLILSLTSQNKPDGWRADWSSERPVVYDCESNKKADDGNVYFTAADGNRYAEKDGKATLVLYCGKGGEYSLPESVSHGGAECRVTCVGSYAFYFSEVTKVTLPDTVTEIGFAAFKDCRLMEEIHLSAPLFKILDYAFSQCISLKRVELPSEVSDLGEAAFERCYALEEITMQNKLKNIRARAFSECRSLTTVVVPDSVRSMGGAVFEYCVALEKAKLSRNVSEIKFSMFTHCRSLKYLTLPAFPELIEEYAFCGCCSLESIVLGRAIATVGDYAFKGCTNLSINAELQKKPSAWAQTWNSDGCPVNWGYKPF